jgi:hypothetical protein
VKIKESGPGPGMYDVDLSSIEKTRRDHKLKRIRAEITVRQNANKHQRNTTVLYPPDLGLIAETFQMPKPLIKKQPLRLRAKSKSAIFSKQKELRFKHGVFPGQ